MSTETDLQTIFNQALAELRGKQRLFVLEYLKDLNGKQAAIRAGYSEKTAEVQASQTLRILKVARAVRAGLDLKAMPGYEILARLAGHARGSMADFLRIDEEEVTIDMTIALLNNEERLKLVMEGSPAVKRLLESSPTGDETNNNNESDQEAAPPKAVRISTMTITRPVARLDLRQAGEYLHLIKKYTLDEKGRVTIELYDAQAALVKLGEHHKLWGKSEDVLKYIDISKLTPDQLERIAAGEDPIHVLINKPDPTESES